MSSVKTASVTLLVANGWSLTLVTVRSTTSVVVEKAVVPPVLVPALLRSAVPPLLPLLASQARTVSAEETLPCQLAVG